MHSHDTIRSAIFTTLKTNGDVNNAIKMWYRLVVPNTVQYPAVAVMDINQPMVGEFGVHTLETTLAAPMDIRVLVLSQKHDVDSADADLGTAYIDVFNALIATPALGLTDFDVVNIQMNTRPFPEYGTTTMGAEIMITATTGA